MKGEIVKGVQVIFGPSVETDAGSVAPGVREFFITETHGHAHLQRGDLVVMVEDPRSNNWLLRLSDMTLHHLKGQADQYVHLKSVPAQLLKRPANKQEKGPAGTYQDDACAAGSAPLAPQTGPRFDVQPLRAQPSTAP